MYKNLRRQEDVRPFFGPLLWQEGRHALASVRGGLASTVIMALAIVNALAMIAACRRPP